MDAWVSVGEAPGGCKFGEHPGDSASVTFGANELAPVGPLLR